MALRAASADVLVLGESHLEYLFGELMSQDELDAAIILAGMIGDQIKCRIRKFNPDRLYLEVRPPIGQGGKEDWFNLRVPQGMKAHFIEGSRDPDELDSSRREANMANGLRMFLDENPNSRVALICGSRHAKVVARRLMRIMERTPFVIEVDYVPAPPGLEKAFGNFRPKTLSK